ncbi:MAG TPA: hypothetical protein VMT66_01725 [Steroidobacteraceae bacterium]|nr:hypothetical protein [Steroidobacteraceae bacterium]
MLSAAILLSSQVQAADSAVYSLCGGGSWSADNCWFNTINPPTFIGPQPVSGELASIPVSKSVTLDVSVSLTGLTIEGGTLRQGDNTLTLTDGLLTVAAVPTLGGGEYDLSGGSLSLGGTATFGLAVGGTVNQSGGTLNATNAISLQSIPLTGVTATYNLSGGVINAHGLEVGNGAFDAPPPIGPYVGSGIFSQSGGSMMLTGPVILGGPIESAPGITGGGVGTLNLSGDSSRLSVNSDVGFGVIVGGTGTGVVNQSEGTVSITSDSSHGGLELGHAQGGSGTYVLSAGTLTVSSASAGGTDAFMYIGNAGGGTFKQNDSSVSGSASQSQVAVEGTLALGVAAGGSGSYDLSGTKSVLNASRLVIGDAGSGSFTQSDGAVTITAGAALGGMELGRAAGGVGSYAMSGGTLDVNREALAGDPTSLVVGDAGSGSFAQTGGEVTVQGTVTLGFAADGSGRYTLSGDASTLDADHLVIRNGSFTQSAGTVTIDTGSAGPSGGSLTVFNGGSYSLTASDPGGATLDVEFLETIQGGRFAQDGGTNKVDGGLSISNGGTYAIGGSGASLAATDKITITNGSLTQTGGTVQANGLTVDSAGAGAGSYSLGGLLSALTIHGEEDIGDNGVGNFSQSAGTHTLSTGPLVIGKSAGGVGTYTLSGTGLLSNGGDLTVGDAGTGTFHQIDGTVTVAGTLALGNSTGGKGTYQLDLGNLTVSSAEVIGGLGDGTFRQVNGVHGVDGDLTVAAIANSGTGAFLMQGGSLQVMGSVAVGTPVAAAGQTQTSGSNSFTQSDGSVQIANNLQVGSGGAGVYTLSGGTLQALAEQIGATTGSSGAGVFNQSGGSNTIAHSLTIGSAGGAPGTYNLSAGIINAGTPKTLGMVNNAMLNVTGPAFIAANLLNNSTGVITVTGATLNVSGDITNFGTITMDPSTLTAHNLTIGASGVLHAGAGDVVDVLGNFINNSTQNIRWNTGAAELDFTGGGAHTFALAGSASGNAAGNFAWGTLSLGTGAVLDLTAGSGDALYVGTLDGLTFSGDTITNIIGSNGLFLYFNAADNPELTGTFQLSGGGELIGLGGSGGGGGGGGANAPEPASWELLLEAGLLFGMTRIGALRRRGWWHMD